MHTIYLVDDDKLAIDKYLSKREAFLKSGFEIAGAETDPSLALAEIRKRRPDAVISDLKMPGMSGMELFERLGKGDKSPLFVIVSAYNEFRDVRKFFLTYGFDYLVKPVRDEDLTDLLERLASRIGREEPFDAALPTAKRLHEMTEYLKEFSHMNHTLESVGERFSASPTSICNMFSRYLGTTFNSYITKLRLERAQGLLKTTDKSVKEIAVICGYGDALYFARVFNKWYGMPPTRFREKTDVEP